MKKIFLSLLALTAAAGALAWFCHTPAGKRLHALYIPKPGLHMPWAAQSPMRLRLKARDARIFVEKNHFNNRFCFLIDMSLPSGRKRFFVYDLGHDSVLQSGLVTHGNCNRQWLEGRRFGNEAGCGCSSLGRYKVGYPYNGRFGRAFKLYGLEKTNDQAFSRYVVLHAHRCVPAGEVDGEICQSNGCPTVSPPFLQTLKPFIEGSAKPVLLWIFD